MSIPVKILVPTDLSVASNSVLPYAVTFAQAFHSKLYLLHVMNPAWAEEPERLEAFPRLSDFVTSDLDSPDLPPLKRSITIGKQYRYNSNIPQTVLQFARTKEIDLICLTTTEKPISLAWWSAGPKLERILHDAPCSVMCMRGRPIKEKDWKRPRLHHVLLLTELDGHGEMALAKITPWVQRFDSLLHVFPLMTKRAAQALEKTVLPKLSQIGPARTNVLMFADPDKRVQNLFDIISRKPIDLVVMTPWTRSEFSSRWFTDVLVRLLRDARCPVLVVR